MVVFQSESIRSTYILPETKKNNKKKKKKKKKKKQKKKITVFVSDRFNMIMEYAFTTFWISINKNG